MYYFCKFLLFSQTSKLLLDPVFSTLRSAAKIQFKFIPICLIAWVLILVNILYSEPRHGLSIWIKDVNRHVARPRYRLPMKAFDWLSGPTFSKEGNYLQGLRGAFGDPHSKEGKKWTAFEGLCGAFADPHFLKKKKKELPLKAFVGLLRTHFSFLESVGPESPSKTSIGSQFITLNKSITN